MGEVPMAVTEVVRLRLDIEGHEEIMWAYVVDDDAYDLILGRPWMDRNSVRLAFAKKSIYISSSRTRVRSKEGRRPPAPLRQINATAFMAWKNRSRSSPGIKVFAASLADIQKALQPKHQSPDALTKIPKYLWDLKKVFSREESDKLPPHRGPKVDHAIELMTEDGKEQEPPWGPLYSMSREELLVLRKELTSYLDRGFIRVSRSSAAAPVLFVKKPGGGLRFCVDYRALNAISKKDRYPLPLIHETLNQISKAKWFTKLDVIQAFHRIRIAEGDEWKTAFRTRFGLYEWMVCPFGLANAPSTFQRYINWALREHIDEDASAYLDDVLIYSDGSRKDHERRVRAIVEKLGKAGLQLDIKKCEFSTKETKYLGFIVVAGEGVRMDPKKVKAISDWEPPRSVRGIRSFVGFANFYRQFIKGFSEIVAPLTKLTGKDVEFTWGVSQQQAFETLKRAFISEPALTHFDSERETIVETDASGMSSGGTLSQFGEDGVLRTVGYFSAKHTPAECNYDVHDKELLAVIKCLQEWDAELRAVRGFTVHTDHKNLEYFGKARQLQERHFRWREILSRYNLQFMYKPGHTNGRADALSRKEEDLPADENDARKKSRFFQMLRPVAGPTPEEEGQEELDRLPKSLQAYMTRTADIVRVYHVARVVRETTDQADVEDDSQDVGDDGLDVSDTGPSAVNVGADAGQVKVDASQMLPDVHRYGAGCAPIPARCAQMLGKCREVREQNASMQPKCKDPYRRCSTMAPDVPAMQSSEPIEEPIPVRPARTGPGPDDPLSDLWEEGIKEDATYQGAVQAIRQDCRKFPPSLGIKASLGECQLIDGALYFRERKWVPNSDPLRTALVAAAHSSPLTGHPGRENTYKILAREWYWPGMSPDIRRYIQNCDICGRTKPWRELRQGFLKPLPVPDRIWKEISMDFIINLPESRGCTYLMVITDRLSKDVVLAPLPNLETETVAWAFIEKVVAYHWFPDAIVSDRGGQFIGAFWKKMCELLNIERRVSTAFHPETDGATERMNSTIEAYLRAFVNWAQDNWATLCPIAQAAIRSRVANSTKVSPFFVQHGYEADPIQLDFDEQTIERHRSLPEPEKAAAALVQKVKTTVEFVQAAMAEAQQEQERQANKSRKEAPILRVGDKVWLEYGKQLSNRRPNKKLDWKNAKFRVEEVLSPHTVRLSTPPGIHSTFHVDRLRLAAQNPLPGQATDDWQPDSILVNGEEEWNVEHIVGERKKRIGRGTTTEYLVKWVGFALCSWEPARNLEETEALQEWEEYSRQHRSVTGTLPNNFRRGSPDEPPPRRR
jgi:hypothetical protein